MPLSQEILHVLSERHGLKYLCQDHILEKLHGEPSKAVEKNDLQRRYLKLSYIYNTPGTSLDNQICHDTQVLLKLTNSITLDGLHAKLSNFQNEKLFILQSIKKSLESIILAQSSPSLQEIKDLMEMYKSAILPSLNHYVSAQEEYLMTVCLSLSEKSKLLQAQITTTTYDGGIGEKALQIRDDLLRAIVEKELSIQKAKALLADYAAAGPDFAQFASEYSHLQAQMNLVQEDLKDLRSSK